MLSATITFNKAVDMSDPLSQPRPISESERQGIPEPLRAPDMAYPSSEQYAKAKAALEGHPLNLEELKEYAWSIDPIPYLRHTGTQRGESVDPVTTSMILPPILMLMRMRRTPESVVPNVNGKDVRVGESLPQGEWKKIETVRSPGETELYERIHEACAQPMGAGVDPPMPLHAGGAVP